MAKWMTEIGTCLLLVMATCQHFVQTISSSTAFAQKVPVITSDGCGVTKGCFREPKACTGYTDCDFYTSWTMDSNQNIMFVISGKATGYVALGFSKSGGMDDSDVYACTKNGEVVRSRNSSGKENTPLSPLIGVSGVDVSVSEGRLKCMFKRRAYLDNNNTTFYDLRENNTYYIIMARYNSLGQDGTIQYHFERKTGSSDPVSFAVFEEVESEREEQYIKKSHGALMVIAWVGFASVGMLMARYFKPMWPNAKIFGVAIWFMVHRCCMILTLLFTVAGFIVIFIHTEEFIGTDEGTIRFLHAIFGTFVTFLVIANPIMAIFRPPPGHFRRPLFNWAHWAVGTGAHNLALITTCFGLNIGNCEALINNLPCRVFWMMIAFIIFHIVMWILFEIQRCMTESRGRTNDIPLHDTTSSTQQLTQNDNYQGTPESTTIVLPPSFDIGFPSIHTIRRAGTVAKTILLIIYVSGVLFSVAFMVISMAVV